jgi:chromosome segregation ATPase
MSSSNFRRADGRTTLGQCSKSPQYGRAIEAALNHNLRTILADDLNAARALLTGNLTVAAPEMLVTPAASATEAAVNHVRIRDERFAPLLRSLLANVVIAENLDAALALRKPGIAVATLGEFIDEHGVLSAVSSSHCGDDIPSDETTRLVDARQRSCRAQTDLDRRRPSSTKNSTGPGRNCIANEVTLPGKEGELNARYRAPRPRQ